jgi:hypothetical protein
MLTDSSKVTFKMICQCLSYIHHLEVDVHSKFFKALPAYRAILRMHILI